MWIIIATEFQKRSPFQDQIDKEEIMNEGRFEPCFEKQVEFG